MRGHNICVHAELTKIIPNYHQILPLAKSSGLNVLYLKWKLEFLCFAFMGFPEYINTQRRIP